MCFFMVFELYIHSEKSVISHGNFSMTHMKQSAPNLFINLSSKLPYLINLFFCSFNIMLLPVALNNGGLGSTSDFDSLQSRHNGAKSIGVYGVLLGSDGQLMGSIGSFMWGSSSWDLGVFWQSTEQTFSKWNKSSPKVSTNNTGLPKIWKEKGQILKYILRQFAPFTQQDLAIIVQYRECEYDKSWTS